MIIAYECGLTVETVFPPIPMIPLFDMPLLLLMAADVAVPKLPFPVAEFPLPEMPPNVAAPPDESEGLIRAPPVTPPTDALFACSPPVHVYHIDKTQSERSLPPNCFYT